MNIGPDKIEHVGHSNIKFDETQLSLELVCCKKWQNKVHDQLLVWGIGDL